MIVVQQSKARLETRTFTVELPFPPSTNNLFLNAATGLGRYPTPAYKAWRKEAAQMLMAQRARCAVGPVEISLAYEERKGRRDLDNLIKPVLDCLVENGIIDGDSKKTVRKITAYWSDSPVGVIVEIRPWVEPSKFLARKIELRSLPDGKGHVG